MADVVRKKQAPPNEPTPAKLARLANKRVNKAITQIRLIGNLGAYAPTAPQIDMIIRAVDAEVAAMKANIRATKPTGVEAFKLA